MMRQPRRGIMRQELSGILTSRDTKTHIVHEVVLPRGAARLRVRLEHPRGAGYGHMLCLSLFDSRGFRGSGHRDGILNGHGVVHEVELATGGATPGYFAGPVPAGPLRLVIHAHRIVEGEAFRYRFSVEGEGLPPEAPAPHPRSPKMPAPNQCETRSSTPRFGEPEPPLSTGSGWRRGDLHAHTVHSDGTWDVRGLLCGAREAGLDFVALTDHNTTSPLADIEESGDTRLLVIAGLELTTFRGHALGLGTREWIDWGVLRPDWSIDAAAEEVRRGGGLFVIAHPMAEGDPVCTGCDWRYDEMMPGSARAMEVWNGPWTCDSNNERALAQWYEWLDRGMRIVATAGSDAHEPGGFSGRIGRNVVWSKGLTERAIIASIEAGRSYLSSGPVLELHAAAGGRIAMMGETIAASSADVSVRWEGCPPGSILRLIGDGAVVAEESCESGGERHWAGVSVRWFTAEIRDGDGSLLAITNPVYLQQGGRPS
jgi:hypothetical protein